MKAMSKRYAIGAAAAAAVLAGSLASGAASPASAGTPTQSRVASVVVQQVTLRLASEPGQVANVRGASKENLAPVIQWPWSGAANERWEPEAAGGGYYRFKSVSSGKCLNVEGGGSADGARVIQYTCGSAANELWKLVPKGIGYQIVVKVSGKCLNVRGGTGQGNSLIQYTCVVGGAPNDVWLPVWEEPLR
ncbi:RICIN domain-containing protein [Streptomyces sp. NBC_01267]|uniref:RICIN domain-containing protein n=1 Tax=Streptomyces sp. NBC_01267 TaxID=2903805 RepID=UPI002E326A18|nr:RICIN domain-containing protein [Streptomyces sp. NBC_01267]